MNRRIDSIMLLIFGFVVIGSGQQEPLIITGDQLFDGVAMHQNWSVVIQNGRIIDVGPSGSIERKEALLELRYPGSTIMPEMIEGHSHILLHPYNETSWNDQVLKESYAERTLRAGNHLMASLQSGITTMRDLGSEGAGYLDVGIRQSIEKGVIEGPDLIVSGPAIVATGSYGPKGFADHVVVPLGANEADGQDKLIAEVRRQIGGGADLIKVYADYRWGPHKEAQPTFTIAELKLIVEVANSSGRSVAAHAATAEGMRRATLSGVSTIEHGDGGTREVFELMKEHKVALCPTLAAGDAISQYRGWRKGIDPEPERIIKKKASFALALQVGVDIVAGGDVGVFPHGENVREFEMMEAYGMPTLEVLQSITAGNAKLLDIKEVGRIAIGMKADIIAIKGDPLGDISSLRSIELVIKNGKIIKE